MSKEVIKFNEIRMARIEPKLFEEIKKSAKKNKRTMGAEVEVMIIELKAKVKELESIIKK